jgi:hypothetical protein
MTTHVSLFHAQHDDGIHLPSKLFNPSRRLLPTPTNDFTSLTKAQILQFIHSGNLHDEDLLADWFCGFISWESEKGSSVSDSSSPLMPMVMRLYDICVSLECISLGLRGWGSSEYGDSGLGDILRNVSMIKTFFSSGICFRWCGISGYGIRECSARAIQLIRMFGK